jgi:hypothetical protein
VDPQGSYVPLLGIDDWPAANVWGRLPCTVLDTWRLGELLVHISSTEAITGNNYGISQLCIMVGTKISGTEDLSTTKALTSRTLCLIHKNSKPSGSSACVCYTIALQ